MTLTLFVTLVTILALISSLLTEGLKNSFNITKPTLTVAIISAIIGWIGGIMAYVLMGIAFTSSSIICLILLAPTLFLVATNGYDKVLELIEQIRLLI